MASIDKRPNGKYRARWREAPGGPQKTRHFSRKADAERFLAGVQADLYRGDYIDPDAGKVTYFDYAERWRAAQVHRPTTAAQVETHLRRHVYPALGDKQLRDVRPTAVQSFVKGLEAKGLAPATVEVIYRYTSAVFTAAVADGLLRQSPCRGVKLPKVEPAKVKPLAVDEVWRLVDEAPDRYRALVLTAAATGLRQGEMFGLTVDRVDFLRRRLTVDRQLVLMPGGAPELAPPKTTASYRDVPLPDVALAALSSHLATFGAGQDGLVFTNDRGERIRRTRFSDVWRPMVKRAGLEGTVFHDLRHHYASLLIRHGESVKVVQARLGHASAAETLDTYSHLWPDSEDRTRQAVDELLGSAEDRLRTAVGR